MRKLLARNGMDKCVARAAVWGPMWLALGGLAFLGGALPGCGEDDSGDGGESTSDTGGGLEDIQPVDCNSTLDCEYKNGELSNPCEMHACVDHVCKVIAKAANTPCGEGATGACELQGCDGQGECVTRSAFDMTPCGANDGCTAALCFAGECVADYVLLTCNDGDPCTTDACENAVCVYEPNTATCDDGDPCTLDDACSDGTCAGTPAEACPCENDGDCADDGDACNGEERCIEEECGSDPATVPDCSTAADSCMAGTCNPETGCEMIPLPDGTPCNDGDTCTLNDACVGQVCTGDVDELCPD